MIKMKFIVESLKLKVQTVYMEKDLIMQTLETMIQGTKVGSYLAFFYGLIIVIASLIIFAVQTNEAIKNDSVIAHNISSTFDIPETSTNNLLCFNGILHYKNVGAFSGYLAYSVNLPLSVAL